MKKAVVVKKQSDGTRKAETPVRPEKELTIMRLLRSANAKKIGTASRSENDRAVGGLLQAAMAKKKRDSDNIDMLQRLAGDMRRGGVVAIADQFEKVRQKAKSGEKTDPLATLRRVLGVSTADGGSTFDAADVEEETK